MAFPFTTTHTDTETHMQTNAHPYTHIKRTLRIRLYTSSMFTDTHRFDERRWRRKVIRYAAIGGDGERVLSELL